MNENWEKITEYGQYKTGFVDVLKTTVKGKHAYLLINYLPQFYDKDQKVMASLLLEGEKSNWTEGNVISILHDCEDRIRDVSKSKFRVFNRLEYMTIQTIFIKDISSLEFGTSGDFSFEKPIN